MAIGPSIENEKKQPVETREYSGCYERAIGKTLSDPGQLE
jgi:hypothetical protein